MRYKSNPASLSTLKMNPNLPSSQFLHAWCVISSRSFSVEDAQNNTSTSALLPLVDMCNHKRPRVCSYKRSADEVVLTALIDLKSGDEVSE